MCVCRKAALRFPQMNAAKHQGQACCAASVLSCPVLCAPLWCPICNQSPNHRIFRIKDPKFAGIAPKECKPMEVPDEEH